MFSKRFFRFLPQVIELTHYAGATPFKIEKHTLKLSVDSKSLPRVYFNFYLIILWIFFSLLIIYLRIKANENDQVYISFAVLFAIILLAVVVSILRFYSHSCCRAISGMFSLVIEIQDDYFVPHFDPEKSKYNLVLEVLLVVLAVNYFGLGVLVTLLVGYDPRAVTFLGRLIPEIYFFAPVKLLVVFLHAYVVVIGVMACGTLACLGTVYGFYVTLILSKELRIKNNCTTYLTTEKLRRTPNLRLIYRSFQLVHQNFMCFLGIYIVILNASVVVSVVFTNFVLLRYWSDQHTIMRVLGLGYTLMFILIWTAILQLGKLLFLKGNKVVNSWRGRDWGNVVENRIMKRFKISCKPILLSYGRQFVIGRQSILVFYRCVTRGTVRALLTL